MTRKETRGRQNYFTTTQLAILRFLGEYRGQAFCGGCIDARLVNSIDIVGALRLLGGAGLYCGHAACSSCGKVRLLASLPVVN